MSNRVNRPDIYDVANWKPVARDQFADRFAEVSLTELEPTEARTTIETLDDGRVRLVVHALMWDTAIADPNDGVAEGPYLMVLYDPGDKPSAPPHLATRAAVCFVRTDVQLRC